METLFSGVPGTTWTPGTTFNKNPSDLLCKATITGTAPTRVEFTLETQAIDGSEWVIIPRGIVGASRIDFSEAVMAAIETDGTFLLRIPGGLEVARQPGSEVRLNVRRVGGDGTTTVVVLGEFRSTKDSPSITDQVLVGGAAAAYDEATGSLSVTPTRTVADEYGDPEPLEDASGIGASTVYYPSAAGFDMGKYDNLVISCPTVTNAILTLEASMDVTFTDFNDVTPASIDGTTGAAPGGGTYTAACEITIEPANWAYMRLKAVYAGASALTARARRRKN